MIKKKILTVTIVAAMALMCAGCGNKKDTTTETTTETVQSESDATPTDVDDSVLYGGTFEGEVTEVTDDEITIEVTDDDGNVHEITVDADDEDIEFTGGGGMAPSGNGDGAAPSGEAPSGDGAAPSGEAPSGDGAAPSGEAPSGDNAGSGDSQTPPEKPDGDTSGSSDGAAPSGEAPSGDGTAPSGDNAGMGGDMTLSSLEEGDSVEVTFDDEGNVTAISIKMDNVGGMGQSSGVDSYDAANEYTEDTTVSDQDISSENTDENAVLVSNGADVTLSKVTIDRESDDSTGGDNSSFYGVGAAALVTDGTLNVSNSTISTDSKGGAGVFAYGDGVAYVSDSTITTQESTSGGIHVAGGGTLYASNLTVETNGESSAAIRSDRGGGTMVVDGGSYTSNGTGSPAIYCTADISVNDSELQANNSEAICIEGKNTIRLFDCDLSGNMPNSSQNDCTWNVILYQSMSGDSVEGNSTFDMEGGSLTAENGGMFYTTNTQSTFILNDVDLNYSDSNDFLLKCTGNANERGWGTTGENGADCTFTAINQEMEGSVITDSISTLNMYLSEKSTLEGCFVDDESCAGNGGDGETNLYIDSSSKWIVTADSTLTNLYSEGSIVDANGKTVTIKGTDGTVYVKGDSSYTITVSSYSDSADMSGASSSSNWSDYEAK